MNTTTIKRIIVDILLLIAIINGWWIVAIILGAVANWFFLYFVELIIAGVIYDSLFGYSPAFGLAGYYATIMSLILFIVICSLKRVLRR